MFSAEEKQQNANFRKMDLIQFFCFFYFLLKVLRSF